MNAPRLPEIIREHSRTDFSQASAWPFAILALIYIFFLLNTRPRDWRVSWFLPIFWMLQAYWRVRHAPLFAVAACIGFANLFPYTRFAQWLALKRPDYYKMGGFDLKWRLRVFCLALGVTLVSLSLQFAHVNIPVIGHGCAKLDPMYWPTDLTETLRANQGQGSPHPRIFTDYIDGGFVIYHAPNFRVFVDDRCELFGDEWLVRFVQAGVENTAETIELWEREYGRFEFALTRKGTAFDEYFRNRKSKWEPLGPDSPTASFYRRKPTQH